MVFWIIWTAIALALGSWSFFLAPFVLVVVLAFLFD